MRVFLAVESHSRRFVFRSLLERSHHHVRSALDGKAALQFLRRTHQSYLVILDGDLPFLNGFQLLYRVAHSPRFRARHRYVLFVPEGFLLAPAMREIVAQVSVTFLPHSENAQQTFQSVVHLL